MTTNEPPLEDLRVFCTIVEQGSLTAAAKALGIPKATVTRRMQRLESALGQRLLNRGGGRFALTEEGRDLALQIQPALRSIEDAVGALMSPADQLQGRLRISAPHTFGVKAISPVLPRFLELHPKLSVTLDLSSHGVDLLADEADIAVRVGDPGNASLAARLLRRDQLLLCASPDYLSSTPPLIDTGDLTRHRMLDFRTDTGSNAFDMEDATGQRRRLTGVATVLRSNEPEVLVHAARHGVGIALVTMTFVRTDLENGSLVQVLRQWPWPERDINALYAPGRRHSPRVRVFLDYLVKCLAQG